MRVAAWCDGSTHGYLELPAELVGKFEHVDMLKSLRDDKLKSIVAQITSINGSDWWHRATKHARNWKSAERVHALHASWLTRRFDGDAGVYQIVSDWCEEDLHHQEWQTNERDAAIGRRKDIYGKFAKWVRTTYSHAVFEDLKLNKLQKSDDLSHGVKQQQNIACLSSLRSMVGGKMYATYIEPAYTSRACHVCGHHNDVGSNIDYACEVCGWSGDRDMNAAHNIRVSTEVKRIEYCGSSIAECINTSAA
jgi:hypothetical protein